MRCPAALLLNAMDADGTQDGFDLELIRMVRQEVSIPVIASGGAGRLELRLRYAVLEEVDLLLMLHVVVHKNMQKMR